MKQPRRTLALGIVAAALLFVATPVFTQDAIPIPPPSPPGEVGPGSRCGGTQSVRRARARRRTPWPAVHAVKVRARPGRRAVAGHEVLEPVAVAKAAAAEVDWRAATVPVDVRAPAVVAV